MFAQVFRQTLEEAGLAELDPEELLKRLPDESVLKILQLIEEERNEAKFNRFKHIYPDKTHSIGGETFYARDLYPKQIEFFAAGKKYPERCAMAANRVGKTRGIGAYELTCHLTGQYPEWWPGYRFRHPIRATAAGKTNETTRDIVQLELLGEIAFEGTRRYLDGSGMIPFDCIGRQHGLISFKQGFPDLVDLVKIKHVNGGWSSLYLRSYEQGRGAFEGTFRHITWFDEEPPLDVYSEALMRMMTTNGRMLLTYTPLEGLTETVLAFLPDHMKPANDDLLRQSSGEDWLDA